MKKIIYSTLAIFAVWFCLDFLVHGLMLKDLYNQTAQLWRPMSEIQSNWWMHLITLAGAFMFSWLWCCHASQSSKNIKHGGLFGAKIGALYGLFMGFGMYGVMPIPMALALAWFAYSIVLFTVAGFIAAAIIKECSCPAK